MDFDIEDGGRYRRLMSVQDKMFCKKRKKERG